MSHPNKLKVVIYDINSPEEEGTVLYCPNLLRPYHNDQTLDSYCYSFGSSNNIDILLPKGTKDPQIMVFSSDHPVDYWNKTQSYPRD